MKNQLKNATVIILVASTYIYSSLAAELSWPQAEVGASESGFSETELELMNKSKIKKRYLGRNILRSETAAIYISALIKNHFGKI